MSTIPSKCKLTAVKAWLKNEADPAVDISPIVRMGYDQYGNLLCRKEPKANASATDNTVNYTYDDTYKLFPATVSYPVTGFPASSMKYYGVDVLGTSDAFTPSGLFGQLYKVIDPNGQTTTYTYDTFGRKKTEALADGFWAQWEYKDSGGVGTQSSNQYVKTWNKAGLWSYSHYDGLKRPFYSKKSGPDSKTIAARTVYDQRGKVSRKTVPFFETEGEGRSWNYAYDAIGRLVQLTNPDTTFKQVCYSSWVTTTVDENKHRKRQVSNAFGQLIEVDEYREGQATSCSTQLGEPYARTTYAYNLLGGLTTVINAKGQTTPQGQTTSIGYDTLGRKTSMNDPDMGAWSYTYWPSGSLKSLTDAKQQTISFSYDDLNRQTRKSYPDTTYVEMRYDEAAATNRWGRLTTLVNQDRTVSTTYSYDPVGRIATSTKTVDSVAYPISYSYANGRLDTVTYPNSEQATYSYDAESIWKIRNPATNYLYATYSGYNALLQPGNIAYGNGVATAYAYKPENNRLLSINTSGPNLQGQNMSFGYEYYENGNIKSIDSSLNTTPDFNSVSYVVNQDKAHRLDSMTADTLTSVIYDDNGNMTSIGPLQLSVDYDNMLSSANDNAVRFTYDGAGKRVKKQSALITRTYIDDLYECTDGSGCGIFIYAGKDRLALKRSDGTFYYHKDHLGSTAMVTGTGGNRVERVSYYPFGEIRSDEGTEFTHKYTGQEHDIETGLYNYNARYYYPGIGRFVSADSIVPNPGNPQSLNRYAYVQNSPMIFVDPTGHSIEGSDNSPSFDAGAELGNDANSGNGTTYSENTSNIGGFSYLNEINYASSAESVGRRLK